MKTLSLGTLVPIVALATMGGLQACGAAPDEVAVRDRVAVNVTVTPAWVAGADRAFPGRIESQRLADVATRTSGVLRSLPVDVGDRVREGQVVAVLDGADVTARIRGAEVQFGLAEQMQGRVDRLASQGAASQQELDVATAALETARATLAEARAQAKYVEVTASFSGVVTERMADVGDLAVPGRPILRLQSDGALRVVADLPADASSVVHLGDSLRVEAGGQGYRATVTRIVPVLDPASRRFRIEAALGERGSLQSGTVVSVHVAGAGEASRWVPEDAVVRRGQLTGIFSVESDTVHLRWLRLGRSIDGASEVLAGPIGELLVVRRPGADVVDGAPVANLTREAAR
jgi:RND family efflux transporter MFP subunit